MIPSEKITFVYKDDVEQLRELQTRGYRPQPRTLEQRTFNYREYKIEQELVHTTSHYKLAILATVCTMGVFGIAWLFNFKGIGDKIRGQRFIAVVIDRNQGGAAERVANAANNVLPKPEVVRPLGGQTLPRRDAPPYVPSPIPRQESQVPKPGGQTLPRRDAAPPYVPPPIPTQEPQVPKNVAAPAAAPPPPSAPTGAQVAYVKLNTDFLQKNGKPHNPDLIKSILFENPGIMMDILEGGEKLEAIFTELNKIDKRVSQAEVSGSTQAHWTPPENSNKDKKSALDIMRSYLKKYPEIKLEDKHFYSAFIDRPYIVQAIIRTPSDADVHLTRMFPTSRTVRDEIDRKRSLEKAFHALKNHPIIDTDEAKKAVLANFEGRTLRTWLSENKSTTEIVAKYNEIRAQLENERKLLPRKAELLPQQPTPPLPPKPPQTAINQPPTSHAAAPAASTTQAAPSPTITPELSREQIQKQLEAKKIERGPVKQAIIENTLHLWAVKEKINNWDSRGKLDKLNLDFEWYIPNVNPDLNNNVYYISLLCRLFDKNFKQQKPKTDVEKLISNLIAYIRDHRDAKLYDGRPVSIFNLNNLKPVIQEIEKMHPGLLDVSELWLVLNILDSWNNSVMMTSKVELVKPDTALSTSAQKAPAAAAATGHVEIPSAPSAPITLPHPTRTGKKPAKAAIKPKEAVKKAGSQKRVHFRDDVGEKLRAAPFEALQPLSAVAEGKKPATPVASPAPTVIDQAKYDKVKKAILKVVKDVKRPTKANRQPRQFLPLPVDDDKILAAIDRNKNLLHSDLCENSDYIKFFGYMIGDNLIENFNLDFIGREKLPLETSVVCNAILKEFVDGIPKTLIHTSLIKSKEAWTKEYRNCTNPKLRLDNLKLLLNEIIEQNPLITQIDSSSSIIAIRPMLYWAMELAKKRNIQLFEDMPGTRVEPTEAV